MKISKPERVGKVLENMSLWTLLQMPETAETREAVRQHLLRSRGLKDELEPVRMRLVERGEG